MLSQNQKENEGVVRDAAAKKWSRGAGKRWAQITARYLGLWHTQAVHIAQKAGVNSHKANETGPHFLRSPR